MLAVSTITSLRQLIVVQVGAGWSATSRPVPGGIGVTEAALTPGHVVRHPARTGRSPRALVPRHHLH